jgi:hypothetical protein
MEAEKFGNYILREISKARKSEYWKNLKDIPRISRRFERKEFKKQLHKRFER